MPKSQQTRHPAPLPLRPRSFSVALARALTLVIMSAILGCAAIPKQAFDKRTHTNIKKIAILQVVEPAAMNVTNIGGAGIHFGLLGGIIDSSAQQSKTDEFTHEMRARSLTVGPELVHALQSQLAKGGYETVFLPNQRPIVNTDEQQDYSHIVTDADAILDVTLIDVGYVSPADSGDYFPRLCADARLIATKPKTPIYIQRIAYGARLGSGDIDHLAADAKYKYGNFSDLMNSSAEAAEGLKAGIDPIAAHIAEQLR